MSFLEIAALMRRHLLAVTFVFVLAAAVLYDFKSTPPMYQESATVVFTAPSSVANPNPYSSFGGDLITTGEVMIRTLMSPAGQQRVREAGGTADFGVGLVNLYNQEYPDYSDPYATMSVTSVNPSAVHLTFAVVARQLAGILASRQAQAKVPPHNRITAHVIGDTGVTALRGSSKRTYAGVVLLTVVTAFMVSIWLDRRRGRRGGIRPAARPDRPDRPGQPEQPVAERTAEPVRY
jgi:hypothetical protein